MSWHRPHPPDLKLEIDNLIKAIWLRELSQELPESVELHGVDISSTKFPDQDTLPKNISLRVGSITGLPSEWSDHFDLINQRFLIVGLLAKDWPIALAEMFRVLKPGGVVQLAEREPGYVLPDGAVPAAGCAMQVQEDLFMHMYTKKGFNRRCGLELPAMLEAAGFVDVSSEEKLTPLGRKWGKDGETGVRTWGGALENMGYAAINDGLVSSEAEYEKLLSDLRQEWDDERPQIRCRMICARKPL